MNEDDSFQFRTAKKNHFNLDVQARCNAKERLGPSQIRYELFSRRRVQASSKNTQKTVDVALQGDKAKKTRFKG